MRCNPRTPGRLCSPKQCTDKSVFRLYGGSNADRQSFVLSPGGQSGTGTGSAACRCHSISTPHSHTSPTPPPLIDTFLTEDTVHRNLPYRTQCESEPSSGLQSPPSQVQPSWHQDEGLGILLMCKAVGKSRVCTTIRHDKSR